MLETDILILLGIVAFVVLGVRDGFFKKLFGILAFLGGLIFATKFMSPFGDVILEWLNVGEEASCVIAFFIIFIFIVVIINLLYRWFGKTGSEHLKIWSRVVGGILGAVQGAVAVSLVLLMFNLFDIPSEETKNDSILYDDVIRVAPAIFDYTTKWMPASKKFFEEFREKFENIKLPHK